MRLGSDCRDEARIDVLAAERQVVSALADLTTAGTVPSGHTQPADWAGLHGARHGQPDRRARHADRRLLPGHIDVQQHPRLAATTRSS